MHRALQGDPVNALRLLHSGKNRFGPTDEVWPMGMTEHCRHVVFYHVWLFCDLIEPSSELQWTLCEVAEARVPLLSDALFVSNACTVKPCWNTFSCASQNTVSILPMCGSFDSLVHAPLCHFIPFPSRWACLRCSRRASSQCPAPPMPSSPPVMTTVKPRPLLLLPTGQPRG